MPPVKVAFIVQRMSPQNTGVPPGRDLFRSLCFSSRDEYGSCQIDHSRRNSHQASTCRKRFLCSRPPRRPLGLCRGEGCERGRFYRGSGRNRSQRFGYWSQGQAVPGNRRPRGTKTRFGRAGQRRSGRVACTSRCKRTLPHQTNGSGDDRHRIGLSACCAGFPSHPWPRQHCIEEHGNHGPYRRCHHGPVGRVTAYTRKLFRSG